MKILLLNNYNYLRGASERVFFSEKQLIEDHGHETVSFSRKHSNHIPSDHDPFFPPDIKTDKVNFSFKSIKTFSEIVYSTETKKALSKLIQQEKPDLAHAHNIYGRLTTSVIDLLAEHNIPTVMTLHDYKLICPNYKLLNKNLICEDCAGAKFYMPVVNKCHKGSYIASLAIALEAYFTFFMKKYDKISLLITPSVFLRNKFLQFGWKENRIKYIPNFIEGAKYQPSFTPGDYFLYLGRLSAEKGVRTLINSFMMLNNTKAKLIIAGEGPIKDDLENESKKDTRIHFTGYLSGNELAEITKNALAVVIPSEWYENAPISILESFAYGKPVIASRIGGIPEMIDDGETGFLFDPNDEVGLTAKLDRMLSLSIKQIVEIGKAARHKAESLYTPDVHYEKLVSVYQNLLNNG